MDKVLPPLATMCLAFWLSTGRVLPAEPEPGPGEPCSVPTRLVDTHPHPDRPVEVSVGIFLIKLTTIDQVSESFGADVVLTLNWRDPRLSAAVRGGSMEECVLELTQIWQPRLLAINQIDLQAAPDQRVHFASDGSVRFQSRFIGRFSSPLDLRDFPFDTQRLRLQLASLAYDPKHLAFRVDPNTTGRALDLSLAGWDLLDNESQVVFTVAGPAGERARLDHIITLAREPSFYLWKFVVPLLFIVLMSSAVFWISPEATAPQLSVAAASVFTLIAFQLGLRQGSPPVAYLTRMDRVVLGASALVFASFGEAVLTSWLVQKGRLKWALRIDRQARWVYFLLFLIVLFFNLVL